MIKEKLTNLITEFCPDTGDNQIWLLNEVCSFIDDIMTQAIGENEEIKLNDEEWLEYGKRRCNELRQEIRDRYKAMKGE